MTDATLTPDGAFEAALVEALPRLRSFARWLAKDPVKADDLAPAALLRALIYRARYEPGSNFGAWLHVIARNGYYTDRTRSRRMVQAPEGLAERQPFAPDALDRLELADVMAAIALLPPKIRRAIQLIGVDGCSYEEAARQMNASVGTVKSRVSRARLLLGERFGRLTRVQQAKARA